MRIEQDNHSGYVFKFFIASLIQQDLDRDLARMVVAATCSPIRLRAPSSVPSWNRISRRVPCARHNTPGASERLRVRFRLSRASSCCPEAGRQVLLKDKKAPARAKSLLVSLPRHCQSRLRALFQSASFAGLLTCRRGILRTSRARLKAMAARGSRRIADLHGEFAKFGCRGPSVCGAASRLTFQQRIRHPVPVRKRRRAPPEESVNSGEAARKGFLSSSASASRWRPALHKAWMC